MDKLIKLMDARSVCTTWQSNCLLTSHRAWLAIHFESWHLVRQGKASLLMAIQKTSFYGFIPDEFVKVIQ